MRSIRELTTDLTQIRMNPTSVSAWYTLATINTRARVILEDAMHTYDYQVQGVLYSQPVASAPCAIALPKNVDRVLYVRPMMSTDDTANASISWKHFPTPTTNLLRIDSWSVTDTPLWAEIGYTESSREISLPKQDAALLTILTIDATVLGITTALDYWPRAGFLELTSSTDTSIREVVRYTGIIPATRRFTGLSRAVEGVAQEWGTSNTVVSLVLPVPNAAIPVWEKHAQAGFYDALVSDRAFYDKYTGIASEQAMPPERLAMLARNYEDKAERGYRRTKRLPAPGTHQVRRLRR